MSTGVGQGDGRKHGNFEDLCYNGQKELTCQTPNRFGDAVPTPDEALFVTNLDTGAVTTVRAPATKCDPAQDDPNLHCFELGVVFSPDGKHVYAVGGGNDAVYDFPVTDHELATTPAHTTYLQEVNGAPGGSGTYQQPNPGTQAARTKGLALTPDGKTLLVLKEQAGVLDVLDAETLDFRQEVSFGAFNPSGSNGSVTYPYQVAVAPNGAYAYVSLQGVGQVATVPLVTDSTNGATVAGVPVATVAGDHPTGLAVSPDGSTLLVANANDDTVSVYGLTAGLPGAPTQLTVNSFDGEVYGASPNAVAFAGNDTAYVALAGDNAVAQLARGDGGFTVSGLLPTGWYPTSVAVRPNSGEVLALAAKGLGARYVDPLEYPVPGAGGPRAVNPYYTDKDNMAGLLSVIPTPSGEGLAAGTALVRRNLDFVGANAGEPHGPIPTDPANAGQSPITHVVYIVRENRTYDQVFGDLATTRNDVDADPRYEMLAPATPNAHAIAGRYASSDSFFSNGEASIQGHYWTTSANVDDYVEKSWRQYYSDRNHTSDSVGTNVSAPKNCSIFQAGQAKSVATGGQFTYKDYGDPVGVFNPSIAPGSVPGGTSQATGVTRGGDDRLRRHPRRERRPHQLRRLPRVEGHRLRRPVPGRQWAGR